MNHSRAESRAWTCTGFRPPCTSSYGTMKVPQNHPDAPASLMARYRSHMLPPKSRGTLVECLRVARSENNLSIRRAATLAKVPASTAQGWFEGRHLPTPALMPSFITLLGALGLAKTPEQREAWHRAVTDLRSNDVIEESPYVGLRSYTADEGDVYVGRERAYESLVQACLRPDAQVVVVVGDSGSGKSSLLAAGLVGRGCAPSGPLAHLEPVTVRVPELRVFEPGGQPTLLVLDQFEEAEQLPADELAAVFVRLESLPENVTCVVALAADSFGFALRDEAFAKHLESPVLVGPLTTTEYTRIIEEPAGRHGRRVSPELVQLAIRDLHLYGEPSPGTTLPLLSSALRRCWQHASGTTIERDDYLATGGLWSALHDEAESVYDSLSPEQQVLARRLLLSMVHVDDEHVLRRSVDGDALSPEIEPIVDAFLSARLMNRAENQVGISHDALLSRWERLAGWVEDEQASLLIARRIRMAAALWDEGGRAKEALMPVEAELWSTWAQSEDAPLLSPQENEFISASMDLSAEQQREQQHTISRIRVRQRVAIVAAAVAGAMALASLVTLQQSNHYRQVAEEATRTSQSRQIALIADEVRSATPNTAGQLSTAAYSIADTVQSRSAVLKSAGAPMPMRLIGPTGNTLVGHSAQHGVVVRGDGQGMLTVWAEGDLAATPRQLPTGGGQTFALAVADVAGRALALVGGQQTAGVWDVTGDPVKLGEFGVDTVTYSAAWRDGTVLFGTLDGQIRRVDFTDPEAPVELAPLELGEEVLVSALATSSEWIVAGGRRDRLELFSTDGAPMGHLEIEGTASFVANSPAGDEFLVASRSNNATLWSALGGELTLLGRMDLPEVAHSALHVGDRLFVAGSFGEIREYGRDLQLRATYPERSAVVSLDELDGLLVAGGTGGATTVWDPASDTTILRAPEGVGLYDIIHGDDVLLIGTSAGGRVVTATDDGGWRELPVEAAPDGADYTYYYAISPDGQVLVNQTDAGDLITLDRVGAQFVATNSIPAQETLSDLRLSPTGRFLALGYGGSANYTLLERTGEGWERIVEVDSWPAGCAFSPDETLFAAMNRDGTGVTIWDLAAPVPMQVSKIQLEDDVIPSGLSFSPTNNLAVGDNRGEISIYSLKDPTSPDHVAKLSDARSSLAQVSYSRDGSRLLAASREGQLWVWQVNREDIELDLQLTPGTGAVMGSAWFRGQIIISVNDGRTVAWPGDAAGAAAELCSRFGERLTEDEWLRLVPGVEPTDGC